MREVSISCLRLTSSSSPSRSLVEKKIASGGKKTRTSQEKWLLTKGKQKCHRKRKREYGVYIRALWHSPSSSNSAVMDLERSVRVVLGALLGGGGAVEKRHGVEEEVKGDVNPLALRLRALLASSRRPVHPVFTALTWSNSGEVDASHLVWTFFRKPNFFMFSSLLVFVSQS